MDARSRAKVIAQLCFASVETALAAVIIYLCIDTQLRVIIPVMIYGVLLTAFSVLVNKTKSKQSTVFFVIFTVVCAALTVAGSG